MPIVQRVEIHLQQFVFGIKTCQFLGQTGFEDFAEPEKKRHLLRLWLCPPDGRPLPPVFAECYGGVTVGDRGGIICKDTRLHAPLVPA